MGGTVVMPSATPSTSFAIDRTIDGITQEKVTFVVLSPAMVHTLDRTLQSHPEKLDSVRMIQLGGDAISRDMLTKCASLFPGAKVCINHGMSEGAGFFYWPFFDSPASKVPCFGEMCPLGKVAPGARVRIWDAERKQIAKRGQPGELHVSCGSIISSYLDNVNATSFYEDEIGRWFVTGDFALVDEKGLIFIIGRTKDLIKRSGNALIPIAIESCIEKYAATQVGRLYILNC
jgi:4-coumarate--CoA ligase